LPVDGITSFTAFLSHARSSRPTPSDGSHQGAVRDQQGAAADRYEHAKTALAECSNIDECKDWADKAEALASYAKQSKDTELRKMCDRIQARAIRRCGELLKAFDRPEHCGRPSKNGDGSGPISVREAATEAGLSSRQQKTAVRVANVPCP
jgi:hypothetical protein